MNSHVAVKPVEVNAYTEYVLAFRISCLVFVVVVVVVVVINRCTLPHHNFMIFCFLCWNISYYQQQQQQQQQQQRKGTLY
jgi:L-asparagine transporter-like permease